MLIKYLALTSTLDEGEWSASRPTFFILDKEPPVPIEEIVGVSLCRLC